MKLTKLEEEFSSAGLVRGSVFLLPAEEALRFIQECERQDISILGVEGFKVFGDKIQPFQEHSFDLQGNNLHSHAIAREFIEKRLNSDIWFEIGTSEVPGAIP